MYSILGHLWNLYEYHVQDEVRRARAEESHVVRVPGVRVHGLLQNLVMPDFVQ
jgi:hypothetical protein